MRTFAKTVCVPGGFVHRADTAGIPTGLDPVGGRSVPVSARRPAAHPFLSPVAGDRHAPVSVAETIRQTTMLAAPAGFGVPAEDQFVMWGRSAREIGARPSTLGTSPRG
ncbi:AfsA-related hotdog domain-containing protein [Streptomyces sp. NPDC059695]|uniref:AfsA-related hotdog domain-containing protein n=1 Tax=Streptomyces sp. NPDC059695 TaxID=3346910 RepID=UPI0036740C0E